MNILVSGANGYIGRALAARLCALPALPDGRAIERITLADLRFDDATLADLRVRCVRGSIAEPAVLEAAMDPAPDLVFHLASVASGQAETDFELGHRVNLQATIALFDRLRLQARVPTVVFTSTIAVFGAPLPQRIDDDTPLVPALSYGAHKQIGEILLADYTRRGCLDGRAVRLPGIVMRPPAPNGALSIFSSDLIRALAAGRSYECPVSEQATLWLMSLPACIDNLLHAATLTRAAAAPMVWTLPALRVSVREIVQAGAALFGSAVFGRISYRPDPALEAQFGRLPPLVTASADAAGFRHDGDVTSLLRRVTEAAAAYEDADGATTQRVIDAPQAA